MEQTIFSVYDEKAQAYAAPFFMPNDGQAIRSFGDAVQDTQSMLNKHPKDYALYKLGTFATKSGMIFTLPQPEYLARATDFHRDSINKQEEVESIKSPITDKDGTYVK